MNATGAASTLQRGHSAHPSPRRRASVPPDPTQIPRKKRILGDRHRIANGRQSAIFFGHRHQPRRPPAARSTLVKSGKASTSVRLAAESGQKPASAWRVWQSEHASEEIQEGGKKGQSRRELSERLDVGRSEMFGGLSSEHFWIDGLRLRAATKARHSAQKAVPFRRLQDGGDSRGADRERKLSIKGGKKCTEPAGGP
jgi:hypothetical protein